LADLVSYNEEHNGANGENNQDGDNNRSWNCGAEGPTQDPEINALRRRQQRNFLCTLFLSQGVPMLCGGDECGRTQQGNNNAYCQDNEISWTKCGHTIDVRDFYGRPIQDDTFLMLLNAHHETVNFVLPGEEEVRWEVILDTRLEEGFLETPKFLASSEEYEMGDRAFSVLRLRVGQQSHARAGSWKKGRQKLGDPPSKDAWQGI
jgi:pullulanase/glycogen debranching enzyme